MTSVGYNSLNLKTTQLRGPPPLHASHFSFLLPWFLNYSCCIPKTVARCPPMYLMCSVVMETRSKAGTHPVQVCSVPRRSLLRPSDNNKVRKSQSLQIGIHGPTINQRHWSQSSPSLLTQVTTFMVSLDVAWNCFSPTTVNNPIGFCLIDLCCRLPLNDIGKPGDARNCNGWWS